MPKAFYSHDEALPRCPRIGAAALPRLVIIEFPSRDAAMAWYNSAEYQAILPYRLKSCAGNLVVVDGI